MKDKNLFFYKTAKGDFNLHLAHISNIEITREQTLNSNYFELRFDVHDYERSPIKYLKTLDYKLCLKMDYLFDGIISITDENEYLYEKRVLQIDLYHACVVSCSDSNDNDTVTITVRADKGILGIDLY